MDERAKNSKSRGRDRRARARAESEREDWRTYDGAFRGARMDTHGQNRRGTRRDETRAAETTKAHDGNCTTKGGRKVGDRARDVIKAASSRDGKSSWYNRKNLICASAAVWLALAITVLPAQAQVQVGLIDSCDLHDWDIVCQMNGGQSIILYGVEADRPGDVTWLYMYVRQMQQLGRDIRWIEVDGRAVAVIEGFGRTLQEAMLRQGLARVKRGTDIEKLTYPYYAEVDTADARVARQ